MGRDTLAPFVILGDYWPPEWSPKRVGEDLLAVTHALGLSPLQDYAQKTQYTAPWYSEYWSAEVRRRTPSNTRAEGWHQDGDLDRGANMDMGLVLWSTNTPVEVMLDGKIFQPKPRQIILLHNLSCVHRRPPYAEFVRWRFRQKVKHDSMCKKLLLEGQKHD